ncbi:hypothetical protein GQ607_009144 [Colletotrichum asianum]|uniref:Uncharacterized protein n=1 Tax=Colletotrichum asianum TaxID=702518 RepID=A0A8H3W9A9_9PEZI|nr:hypothetical protein GQ607_009144 [Colletotrichum asianum]
MPRRTLSSAHGGDAPLVEEEGNRPAVRSKTWEWYGSICHRNKPPKPRLVQQRGLYLDRCLYGEGICDAWPGEAPSKCCIGVMGIMLSCKQARDEVLSVIYSTNTIHIASEPLIQALLQRGLRDSPQVMGPGIGLATSLEIKWRFDLFSDSTDCVCTEHRRRLTQSLELLPQAFPGLSRLTLAFEDRLYYMRLRPSENMAEVESVLLKPLLSAATKLKLQSFDVEVPHSLFDELRLVGNIECGDIPDGGKWNYWDEWIHYPFIREGEDERNYRIKRGEMSNIDWHADGRSFLFSSLLHGF